jgi:hypothetical protein
MVTNGCREASLRISSDVARWPCIFGPGAGAEVSLDQQRVASQLTVSVPTGSVTLSDVTIIDSTKITAIVQPMDTDPAETATLILWGKYFGPMVVRAPTRAGTKAAPAAALPADSGAPAGLEWLGQENALILPQPVITCAGASMKCNGNPISVIETDGATPNPQEAVAGQKIVLTTTPTQESLPPGVIITQSVWTVDGKTIGGDKFGPRDSNGSPKSSTVTATVENNTGLTTYWLYPSTSGTPFNVTYYYCVIEVPYVEQCSSTAEAAFQVNGPTGSVAAVLTLPDANNTWEVATQTQACPNPFLIFGGVSMEQPCPGAPDPPGIYFRNDAKADSGKFFWLQIIGSGSERYIAPGLPNPNHVFGPGLDNVDPYYAVDEIGNAYDGPGIELLSDYTIESKALTANMHLMWQAEIDPSHIPVPVGYVNWSISSKATKSGGNKWTLACGHVLTPCPGARATSWASSDTTGPEPDMPTWSTIVPNN